MLASTIQYLYSGPTSGDAFFHPCSVFQPAIVFPFDPGFAATVPAASWRYQALNVDLPQHGVALPRSA